MPYYIPFIFILCFICFLPFLLLNRLTEFVIPLKCLVRKSSFEGSVIICWCIFCIMRCAKQDDDLKFGDTANAKYPVVKCSNY